MECLDRKRTDVSYHVAKIGDFLLSVKEPCVGVADFYFFLHSLANLPIFANRKFVPHNMSQGKIIVISAPSGSGKSTIINSILEEGCFDMDFSVSATNRNPRPGEEDGVHYHFLSTEEFRNAVDSGQFLEWEEVYPGRYYGTMRSEVDQMLRHGRNVILDIDVRGALNVKKLYGNTARTIFIAPPIDRRAAPPPQGAGHRR